ncbi:MAG: hypothetical protein H0T82_11005 [Sphingomonas sp.]|nr:hypothetical protein [Sphingomonas sp.]
MAGMREMALGIASALRVDAAPNPLPVELWGYAPEDAAQLLRYIVDECRDAGIAVERVAADPLVVQELSGTKTESGVVCAGVMIIADSACEGRFSIYRAHIRRGP